MATPAGPAFEDLAARARIRDAALLQFARLGTSGATIRGIAEAAGVSPGLVQHHFGSKESLREACDSYVFDIVRRAKQEALEGGMADPNFLSVVLRTALPVQRYLARAMVDGSPSAAALFDDLVDFSEQYLRQGAPGMSRPNTSDLHAYAAVMTAMNVGLFVLHEHLARALDADPLSVEGYPRLGQAMLEIYADNLLSPEVIAQARVGFERMRAASSAARPTPPAQEDDDA